MSLVSTGLALSGCGASVQIDSKPVTELRDIAAQPPAPLSADCDWPVAVADAALSAGEVERLWGADRAALVSCGERHGGLGAFYRSRDKGLSGR